jgi:hypothetical protein
LIVCGHCGRPVTGEIVTKKSTGKQYVYYRCARYTAPGHPRIRLREEEIEKQIIDMLAKLEQPKLIRDWFRNALIARGPTTTNKAGHGRETFSGNLMKCAARRNGFSTCIWRQRLTPARSQRRTQNSAIASATRRKGRPCAESV